MVGIRSMSSATALLLLLPAAVTAFVPAPATRRPRGTTSLPLRPTPLDRPTRARVHPRRSLILVAGAPSDDSEAPPASAAAAAAANNDVKKRKVAVIGAGWGGLSAAHALSAESDDVDVTVIDAASRAGGLVRDGYTTASGQRPAEAGQHGFWDNYRNIFKLLEDLPNVETESVLTGYDRQGQYSPQGLEAEWPVYRDQSPRLPTGLAQALYTKFINLPPLDRATAFPLVLAFSEFDDSPEAWEKYDKMSFRDLCARLGVSRRCYEEAFEPMILTGLFAPGDQCSAAAALGMAYFFVLKSQNSFDVRWCRGNVGDRIFQPWVERMASRGVTFRTSTRVVGFETTEDGRRITGVRCRTEGESGEDVFIETDDVVFAVGASALNGMVRGSPELARHAEFRRFANLRGTGVLATRLFLDRTVETPYSANACWGFDRGVGMTFFDITKLHDDGSGIAPTIAGAPGSVIEVDYYHSASLLVMDDDAIVEKAKRDLDTMLGKSSAAASVVDAAVVRLPQAVNWYYPGSYADMPDVRSADVTNAYFAGDIVRSRHGSWSQEKAYVTGIEAANAVRGRPAMEGIVPLGRDEPHVAAGRSAVAMAKTILGGGDRSQAPSLVDFLL